MRLTNSSRQSLVTMALLLATLAPAAAHAQKAAAKTKTTNEMRMPKTATARCGDSTWSKANTQQGACSSHGGVAKWFGKAPGNVTGRCNDGEYWTNEERRGACSAHAGVAYWVEAKKAKKT